MSTGLQGETQESTRRNTGERGDEYLLFAEETQKRFQTPIKKEKSGSLMRC